MNTKIKALLKKHLLNDKIFKNRIWDSSTNSYITISDQDIEDMRNEIKKDIETAKKSRQLFYFNPIIKTIKSKICG